MLIPLHVHSYYSFLAGLASPAELAQAAAQQAIPALALTDYQVLSGAVEFYDACQAVGVRPLLGLELQVTVPIELAAAAPGADRLVLLAMDMSGWSSLCRLSSALAVPGEVMEAAQDRLKGAMVSRAAGPPEAVLAFERLAQDTRGLICLSGGGEGLYTYYLRTGGEAAIRSYLQRLRGMFPDRLYVALQWHSPEDQALVARLAALARHADLPVVATQAIYYLHPVQAGLQRVLTAIRLNCPLEQVPAEALAPPGASFTAQAELAARFADYPQALAATQEVAERCRLELPLGQPHYPQLPLPDGQTAGQVLRQKAEAGAHELYARPALADLDEELPFSAQVQARLDRELAAIEAYGYAPLFLVMEQIVGFAREKGIPISSRGSAASSLVAHCLGITSPDPLRLNLYFERFINPARATPPDIDTDICSRRRDEVIRFVYGRFGAGRVAMVCTVNRFRRRSALREVSKAYGLYPAEIKRLAESLPYRGWGPASRQAGSAYAELSERYPSPRHQAIFRDAAGLIGIPDHLSLHPGGMVIAPGPLTDLVPIQLAAKGVTVTQFDLESIERLGLVKIDLLGIRGLTVLGDVARALRPVPADRQADHLTGESSVSRDPLELLASLSDGDEGTVEIVRTGGTIGCFQIESPGMRATLKEIQAHSVDDLMVALALYRPGPLTGGLKDAFVRRHRGEERPAQLHPALTPLLQDTYGVILYQEQVLRIAHDLAGLSLADADLLRRAMSHFDPGEQMQTLRARFIAGAQDRSQVPPEVAERIWELMAAFAGYGFPKAHAASYAQIGWESAWCKAHYPAVFMTAVLANWGGYYRQSNYLTEARRLGLSLQPPHVNYAVQQFSLRRIEGRPVLFMGLDQVKDLTRRTQARILSQRPFHSLMDFLARVDPRPVEAENLARAGALGGFGTIPSLLRRVSQGGWRGGQLRLFDLGDEAAEGEQEWSLAEQVAAQEAVLGVSVVAHRLELFADQIAATGAVTTVEAAARAGQRLRVAGMRQTWRRSTTEHGEYIYLLALEDLEGMLDVEIPAPVYRRLKQVFSVRGPYVIEGQVSRDRNSGEPFLRAEQAWRIA
jgi:DNA polymerase-3 subunit alpha